MTSDLLANRWAAVVVAARSCASSVSLYDCRGQRTVARVEGEEPGYGLHCVHARLDPGSVSGVSARGRDRGWGRAGRRTRQVSSTPSCDSSTCRTRRPARAGVPSPRSGGGDQRSTTAATRYARPCLAWLCPCSEERLAVRRRGSALARREAQSTGFHVHRK
jgi:hypothetical protein